jgi:site-specific DNA-methyltransferase (adenine-specific)/adenine-specific DNA-methyltransferase
MPNLSQSEIKKIINLLKEGNPLIDNYKEDLIQQLERLNHSILFDTKKEYELIYADKEREEDILTDTMAVPLQRVKTFRNGTHGNDWTNMLIFGDNLQVLKTLVAMKQEGKLKNADGSLGVKLIYIDPPFATRQEFRGSQDQKAYQDKIVGAKFLEFLRKRLVFLRELLSDDGSIYVHLDWKKVHYVKTLMDEIFGEVNFQNEIIWFFIMGASGNERFGRKHQTIFFYKRSDNAIFNRDSIGIPYNPETIARAKRGEARYEVEPEELERRGKNPGDVWFDINPIQGNAIESVNYPTQKPEALLDRIIQASSNPGDIVLDCFAGSGTTQAVSEKLGMRWIGVDCGKLAIYTIQKRLLNIAESKDLENPKKKYGKLCKPFTLYNAGLYDYKMIKGLPWEQYRDFSLTLFQCRHEKHEISKIELDGYLGADSVMVFNYQEHKDATLDRGFIDDLHKYLGNKVGKRFFIIAPAASVRFLEDYIEKGKTKYFVLRIPYSIIEEIHNRGFTKIKQPVSEMDVNDTVDAVGFDFIQVPSVECQYFIRDKKGQLEMATGTKECTVKIDNFESKIISRKPLEFANLETLSMVMLDYDFNGEVFDLDEVFYAEDLKKSGYEVRFAEDKVKKQIMIIYVDIFGNEKREIKTLSDFNSTRNK